MTLVVALRSAVTRSPTHRLTALTGSRLSPAHGSHRLTALTDSQLARGPPAPPTAAVIRTPEWTRPRPPRALCTSPPPRASAAHTGHNGRSLSGLLCTVTGELVSSCTGRPQRTSPPPGSAALHCRPPLHHRRRRPRPPAAQLYLW